MTRITPLNCSLLEKVGAVLIDLIHLAHVKLEFGDLESRRIVWHGCREDAQSAPLRKRW